MVRLDMPGFKRVALALAAAISSAVLATTPASAQSQHMERKLMAIKQAQGANKQKLA